MQTIAPAAAFHRATSVFVHDHHLVILHNVLHIFFVETVGLKQLGGHMNTFASLLSSGLHTLFLGQLVLWREGFIGINFVMRGHSIRHHKGF